MSSIVIDLDGERPISWNKYFAGRTGWARQAETNRVAQLMMTYCPTGPMFEAPVDINVCVGFDKRPLDPDNVCCKGYVDGLKGRIIKDDTVAYVRSIKIEAFKAARAFVTIMVSEVET